MLVLSLKSVTTKLTQLENYQKKLTERRNDYNALMPCQLPLPQQTSQLSQVHVDHDVPSFSSDLLLDIKQTPLIFSSEYIFNSHYMFRRSGPGHMLLHTVHNQKVQGRISLSLMKVKVKFGANRSLQRFSFGKN